MAMASAGRDGSRPSIDLGLQHPAPMVGYGVIIQSCTKNGSGGNQQLNRFAFCQGEAFMGRRCKARKGIPMGMRAEGGDGDRRMITQRVMLHTLTKEREVRMIIGEEI